ncbi:MAG TPA: pilus assembly protein TadG-related protein [Isosphaeraceae bacterium]|jgi:Flp pilus assembly protein TadG
MRRPARRRPRSAQTLILFALLLPIVLGMTGLVIDGGLLLAAYRQVQNAADAAALAAAMERIRGQTTAVAAATGANFVKSTQYNNLPGATVTVNIPPLAGAYAGDNRYVEAVVTNPVQTTFIQVLGINRNRQVGARAVAGTEQNYSGTGAMALDRSAIPGVAIGGGGHLIVHGTVVDNSEGTGLDENNHLIDLGLKTYAATTGNGATLQSTDIFVVGGVDVPANYQPDVTGGPNPLHAGILPQPDPMKNVPVPRAGLVGVTTTNRGSFQATGGTSTINPGVYSSIKITNNAVVTFNPGIYIIKVSSNGNNGLSITGGAQVTGDGVMIYNTGSDFDINTGLPDANDGENAPPAPGNANFGDITINGSMINLRGLNNPSSPFDGILIYQRRRNTRDVSIQGNGSTTNLDGTVYAKWSNIKLAGSGQYGAQFFVGAITVAGNGNFVFDYSGKRIARSEQVFLVE